MLSSSLNFFYFLINKGNKIQVQKRIRVLCVYIYIYKNEIVRMKRSYEMILSFQHINTYVIGRIITNEKFSYTHICTNMYIHSCTYVYVYMSVKHQVMNGGLQEKMD